METDVTKLSLVDRFLLYLEANGVSMQIKPKQESVLMKILGKLLFFNKRFMERYFTTIGRTVYTPTKEFDKDSLSSLSILAHEAVHMDMSRAHPILYVMTYLFPQCLAAFAFLALLPFTGFGWFLLALLFLLPWPAPGRAEIEKWGYLMTLAVNEWNRGKPSSFEREFALDQFDGSAYYWMRRGGRTELRAWFSKELSKLNSPMFPSPIFKQVFYFMKQEKLLHYSLIARVL